MIKVKNGKIETIVTHHIAKKINLQFERNSQFTQPQQTVISLLLSLPINF